MVLLSYLTPPPPRQNIRRESQTNGERARPSPFSKNVIRTRAVLHNRQFARRTKLEVASLRLHLVTPHPLQNRPHRDAAWSLGNVRFVLFDPCHAGDVQMDPGCIFREHLEELGSSNRAAPPSSRVLDIADIAFDHLGVFFAQRQAPEMPSRRGEWP